MKSKRRLRRNVLYRKAKANLEIEAGSLSIEARRQQTTGCLYQGIFLVCWKLASYAISSLFELRSGWIFEWDVFHYFLERAFWLLRNFERVLFTSVAQALSNSLQPHGDSLPGSTVHGILLARILEAIPVSWGSSHPRERIQVSCIVGRFFAIWATREAQLDIPGCGSSHHPSHVSPPPAQTLPPPAGLPPCTVSSFVEKPLL